jgi:hypothetical protein
MVERSLLKVKKVSSDLMLGDFSSFEFKSQCPLKFDIQNEAIVDSHIVISLTYLISTY